MLQVLCAALSSWSTFARQHARLRTIVVRIVHRDMAAALLSWRDYMRRMADARALLRRVVTSQKQRCWDTWWQYATQVPHNSEGCFRRTTATADIQVYDQKHAVGICNRLRLEGALAARGCPVPARSFVRGACVRLHFTHMPCLGCTEPIIRTLTQGSGCQ